MEEIIPGIAALQSYGVTLEHLLRLKSDNDYARQVAIFMICNGNNNAISRRLVQGIMGKNLFDAGNWLSIFKINFNKRQRLAVANFPWNEDILNAPCPFVKGKSVSETHFAFLGIDYVGDEPLTIIKWRQLYPGIACKPGSWTGPRLHSPWPSNQKFAVEATCKLRWYLMLLESVPNSTSKSYDDQVAMLPPEYEVPNAIEELTKNILYYRKNDINLNPDKWSRCRSTTSDGYHVFIGFSGEDSFSVSAFDDIPFGNVGIAASRKIPVI